MARRALDFVARALREKGSAGQPIWPIVPSSLYCAFTEGRRRDLRVLVNSYDASVYRWGAIIRVSTESEGYGGRLPRGAQPAGRRLSLAAGQGVLAGGTSAPRRPGLSAGRADWHAAVRWFQATYSRTPVASHFAITIRGPSRPSGPFPTKVTSAAREEQPWASPACPRQWLP